MNVEVLVNGTEVADAVDPLQSVHDLLAYEAGQKHDRSEAGQRWNWRHGSGDRFG